MEAGSVSRVFGVAVVRRAGIIGCERRGRGLDGIWDLSPFFNKSIFLIFNISSLKKKTPSLV